MVPQEDAIEFQLVAAPHERRNPETTAEASRV
jgi:hypothetical protein